MRPYSIAHAAVCVVVGYAIGVAMMILLRR